MLSRIFHALMATVLTVTAVGCSSSDGGSGGYTLRRR
jgi:hypothetical protein